MKCLCYSKEKGLYINNMTDDTKPADCLFVENDERERRTYVIDVPNEDFTIKIVTKLGPYRIMAWHFAQIEYKGKSILNFDAKTITILDVKIDRFDVIPGNWNELFEQIIYAWSIKDCDQDAAATIYLDKISKAIQVKSIYVKSTLQHPKQTKWWEPFILILHMGDIISDFVEKLGKSTSYSKAVIDKTIEICHEYLTVLNKIYDSLELDKNDSRVERLSKNTVTIIMFVINHRNGIDLLDAFFGKIKSANDNDAEKSY